MDKSKLVVGNARIDENNEIHGGKAGNQTGRELRLEPYFTRKQGWYVIRPKNAEDAVKIANAMVEACNNKYIGYDQYERTTVITQLRKYGTLGKIETPCECDCSELVRACCIQAGIECKDFYTGTEVAILESTGRFEKAIEVNDDTELFNGDILVTRTKGHTLVIVSGNERPELKKDTNILKDESLVGDYKTTGSLNIRKGPGTNNPIIGVLPKGTVCHMHGSYSVINGTKWFHVTTQVGIKTHIGYVSSKYLTRA